MPTGEVLNRNFHELLEGKVRYEIPFFQRGYTWTREQWKTLLNDIQEQVLDNLEGEKYADAEHFFGPVVVLEKTHSHPALKRFMVIDGQQRITTVYAMLAIIKEMMEQQRHQSSEAAGYARELESLLSNSVHSSGAPDDYLNLKVFSAKGDRLPTYKLVFGQNPQSPTLNADLLSYLPEHNQVDQLAKFLRKSLKKLDVPTLWSYAQALLYSLKIVWIPLGAKDDPQAIFESLNDKGMPLSAAELLCNFLFRPLMDEDNNNHEQLHTDYWLKAQREAGDFEDYLRNLFSIGEKKMIGKHRRLYIHFKTNNRKLSRESALSYLRQIKEGTSYYQHITDPVRYPYADARIAKSLYKILQTNMTSVRPFLIALLRAVGNQSLSMDACASLLHETYVLLVRRKVAGLPTTRYDALFPSLLGKLINEPDKIRQFHKVIQADGLFVPDQVFEDGFLEKELYSRPELNFTRHVLEEIDRAMQAHGETPDYSSINTVEHILPQQPTDIWNESLGADARDVNLPRITNTLGNLCLNSAKANSSHGRKPFAEKQAAYHDLSALARDVKQRSGPWNIAAIQQRSRDLAAHALRIWAWQTVLI